jgi:hypothetical protein
MTTDTSEYFSLPRFQQAIRETRPDLPNDTYKRYRNGRLPRAFVRLLIQRPDLAEALCADIRDQATISKSE